MVGLVIDDFISLEQVPDELPGSIFSASIADEMVEAYRAVRLVPNDKKRFRDQVRAKFWGISIHGEDASTRASVTGGFHHCSDAQVGCDESQAAVEVIAGSWTSLLQCRKRAMCLLSEIFEQIQQHSYGETFAINAELQDELWCLVVLCPVLCADLRAQVCPELSMVDASDSWTAEVATDMPDSLSEELFRQRLTKACWTKLLSPLKALQRVHGRLAPADEVPEGEEEIKADPLWTAAATSKSFRTVRRRRVRRRAHINISEVEAYLEAEGRKARRYPNSRLLIGSDSQVVLGVATRGRSSSRSLNLATSSPTTRCLTPGVCRI